MPVSVISGEHKDKKYTTMNCYTTSKKKERKEAGKNVTNEERKIQRR
jgi:hypothetical protein